MSEDLKNLIESTRALAARLEAAPPSAPPVAAPVAAAPSGPPPPTMAEIIAATVAAMQPQQAARPAAAAPGAPSGHALPTLNGVVNPFSLTPAELKQVGPKGVRQLLAQIIEQGSESMGNPTRKLPPKRG